MTDTRDTDTDPAPGSTVTRPDITSVPLTPHPISLEQITPRSHRPIVVTVLSGLVAVAATTLIAAAALFHFHGGAWFIVKTPSMGTAAPVGTLVLTVPTTVSDLHVGDVVAFHPPTNLAETYTHRIIAISADGLLTTRGDINGATDPWQVTGQDLVGKAVTILPGLGWLIRGVPIVLLGIVVVFLATSRVKDATKRSAYRLSGMSLAVSAAAFVLKPFTGVVVEQVTTKGGHPGATVVSTGLLPIRVQALHGTHADLVAGQVGHVTVPASAHQAFYSLSTGLHLGLWGWVALIGVCCAPLLWTMIVGLPPKETATP
ncbi:S26 family signal peptidase [Frondihabitans peucedani]|uniref:Peptidase S26 domain-containing protein n=1 Tax=Frondihabitans peucedani TaxID=598626 RepID=A0ABP8E2X0_9MICO